MTDCLLCGNAMAEGDGGGLYSAYHATCVAEYHSREDSNTCVRCGAAGTAGEARCGDCDEHSPYRGYPPGGA